MEPILEARGLKADQESVAWASGQIDTCYGTSGNILKRQLEEAKSMEPLTLILGLSGIIEALIREIQASGVELTPELLAESRKIRDAARAAAHEVP